MIDDRTQDAPMDQLSWPGGWYVFNDGKVEGPYSARDTFYQSPTNSDGKPLLVSRKGFTQWYALKDLAEIFKITENFGRKVAAAQQPVVPAMPVTTPPPLDNKQETVPKNAASEPETTPRVTKRTIGPLAKSGSVPSAISSLAYAPPMADDEVVSKTAPQSPQKEETVAPVVKDKRLTKRAFFKANTKVPAANVSAAEKETPEERKRVMQEYFFVRGRLRLGKIRSPWASAFFGIPFSAGILWPIWMHSMLKEIFYHSANRAQIPTWIVLAGMVPGLHIYATYRLACLVREMEQQNRYKSISPGLAALFSAFPPFAMAYLQDGANRHWLLHARHVQAGKPAA